MTAADSVDRHIGLSSRKDSSDQDVGQPNSSQAQPRAAL